MLDWLAKLVTTRRPLVLGTLLVITGLLATQLTNIQADPAPESLISSFEDDQGDAIDPEAIFRETFGDMEKALVLLVRSDDVVAQAPLQFTHDLSLHLQSQGWVERVESITLLPMPRRVEGGGEDSGSLDDLDSLDSLDDLDSLDEDGDAQGDLDDDVFNALLDLVEADPERFPDGIGELGPRLSEEIEVSPVVDGPEVDAEEAAEMAEALSGSPLLIRRLVSEDRTVSAIAIHFVDMDARTMRQTVEGLSEYLEGLDMPPSTEVHIAGLPYVRSTMVTKMRSDQLVLIPITLLVCLFLLWISFQWFPGVVLPVAAVIMTAIMVVGGMALVGEPMNVLNNIIPVLLIIIGISDSIHLVGRYLEELSHSGDKELAGHKTIVSMAVACLLTSVTTAVGLASLVVSQTVMLRNFGINAAVGVMVAYVVTITFIPSIITWAKPPKSYSDWGGWLEGWIMTLTDAILRRPWVVVAGTTVLVGLCTWGATTLRIDHALLDQFDEDDPAFVTTVIMEEKLDGVRPLEVVMVSETEGRFDEPEVIAAIEEIADWALEHDEVILTMGHSDVLRESYYLLSDDETVRQEAWTSVEQVRALENILRLRDRDPLSHWISRDGTRARLQIKVRDVGAQATIQFIDELDERLAAALGDRADIAIAYTGEAYTGSVGMNAVVTDLLASLGTAILIIVVLLSLLFRSVRLGLLSIPPNILPLVGTMAYMAWRGIPLNASTVIVFSISLGLAVDGTIHVLHRFREETQRGLRSNAALIRAARGTGRAIVVSCLTLMAGFSVLLLSSFVPVRQFGELIAATVGFTLIATLVVQPALLKIAGLSRSQKRAHAEEDARIAAKNEANASEGKSAG